MTSGTSPITERVESPLNPLLSNPLICYNQFNFPSIDTNDTFAANGLQTLLGIEEENFSANIEVTY